MIKRINKIHIKKNMNIKKNNDTYYIQIYYIRIMFKLLTAIIIHIEPQFSAQKYC